MRLTRYEDFLNRVDELGFMTLSGVIPGFPALSGETPGEIWHTGDPETDPWRWKDRAAEEKKLAFGCIIGGHKGFISPRMYALFYKAFHPPEHMEERRASGEISRTVWQLWQLFEDRTLFNTSDIRQAMGVTLKKGGGKVDSAIKELQQHFYITVAGSGRKVNKFGQPYGWAVNVYDRIESWAPEEWMEENTGLMREEACERILEAGLAISRGVSRIELEKLFCIVY